MMLVILAFVAKPLVAEHSLTRASLGFVGSRRGTLAHCLLCLICTGGIDTGRHVLRGWHSRHLVSWSEVLASLDEFRG